MTDADLDTAFQCNMRLAAKVEALQSELATLHTRALAAEARVRELTAPLDGDEGRELAQAVKRAADELSECAENPSYWDCTADANAARADALDLHEAAAYIERQAARITALTAPPSEEVVEKVAISLCKKWPKTPDGCAMLCMDRLGGIPAAGCRHAKHVHGERARAAIEALQGER